MVQQGRVTEGLERAQVRVPNIFHDYYQCMVQQGCDAEGLERPQVVRLRLPVIYT